MSEIMTTAEALEVTKLPAMPKGRSLWKDGLHRLKKDRLAMISIGIVAFYAVVALLAKFGVIASTWNVAIGEKYMAPSLDSIEMLFGTDIFGRSVFYKTIQGT